MLWAVWSTFCTRWCNKLEMYIKLYQSVVNARSELRLFVPSAGRHLRPRTLQTRIWTRPPLVSSGCLCKHRLLLYHNNIAPQHGIEGTTVDCTADTASCRSSYFSCRAWTSVRAARSRDSTIPTQSSSTARSRQSPTSSRCQEAERGLGHNTDQHRQHGE